MDPFAIGLGILNTALGVYAGLQKAGMLGGSAQWLPYAQDLVAILGNAEQYFRDLADPGLYAIIDAMPQAQKEAEIRRRLLPEGWAAKEARIREELKQHPA